MLDINKVYVVLHRDNATGHVSGDDPRMKPFLATNAMIEYEHGEPCLAYWAIGDERGHLLEGSIIRQLPNGIVFNARHINETITLTEFTMQEFEQRCRPDMERMTPESTRDLRNITDVYAFCRQTAPTIHQPEQEEQPMKLTKADIDKVRHIEGFPIARDEDIIALSRPPYYTACPNPFIEDFIRENGTPYDETTDDYHREPFAADVSEGKNDPIYSAHGYHTKVPYKAIMRYILHYTTPGDLVYDGFCGTGMTGVAAQMCGCPEPAFKLQIEQEMKESGVEWGARIPVLNDLSPAATFIAYNYNTPINVEAFRLQAERLLEQCTKEYGWMYQTQHVDDGGHPVIGIDGHPIMARLNYTVWADLIVCPSCAHEFNFFSVAQDEQEGRVKDTFLCPRCQALLKKTDCARALETQIDPADGQPHQFTKQVPVLIEYSYQGKKYKKKPDSYDMETIRKIANTEYPHWFPTDLMMGIGEKWGDSYRSGYHQGVTRANHFYTKKSILAISYLWQEMKKYELSSQMEFMVDQIILGMSKLARYVPTHFSQVNQYLSGTLYIGSQYVEVSPWYILDGKVKGLLRAFSLTRDIPGKAIIETGSAETSGIPNDSIDYIFTDPPFGDNLMYSELNFLTEAWMKVITNNADEAIVNTSQNKGVAEYQAIMERCFAEYYRVLKPQRWITVEFHNSRNSVWNAIQEALNRVGFIVADVRTLDKKQGSFKQIVSASAVKQDLVISAYKPKESFVREFRSRAGDPEMAWEFVRQHLHHVPITADGNHDGKLDMIAERQDYLLFDRMVAWHIMNGIPIPMDAHTFYDGLRQRFLERDGMFFLPDQVTEYDDKRAHMELDVQQMSFLVTDEKNAIAWLNYILAQGSKTYQEIQPLYLQELHQSKQEKMPELLDMLRENFVQDEKGAWYIPDLNNAADLAKVRRKALLKEFYDSCVPGKGKLKVFRMEAIRAGFDECWKKRDFATIVSVGERLPEAALQEDQTLLMYYDNACSRV